MLAKKKPADANQDCILTRPMFGKILSCACKQSTVGHIDREMLMIHYNRRTAHVGSFGYSTRVDTQMPNEKFKR